VGLNILATVTRSIRVPDVVAGFMFKFEILYDALKDILKIIKHEVFRKYNLVTIWLIRDCY